MGYRSDLVFGVSKRLKAECLLTGKWPELLDSEPDSTSDTHFYYEVNSYKWYDAYPEVIEMTKFLSEYEDSIHDELPDIAGIRIGEETDDIEEFGMPWELGICIERTITY